MRARLRSLLLVVLLIGLLLEGLAWLRAPLLEALHRAYPSVGLDRNGSVVYYDVEDWGASVLDSDRRVIQTMTSGQARDLELAGRRWIGRGALPVNFDAPRFLRREYHLWFPVVGWMTSSPLETLALSLNQEEARRRAGVSAPLRGRNPPAATPSSPRQPDRVVVRFEERLPIEWKVEHRRLVCRETGSGSPLAGFGPDGVVTGERAAEGERFGRLGNTPTDPLAGWTEDERDITWLLFEHDSRRLVLVSLVSSARTGPQKVVPSDSLEHVLPSIKVRPLVPYTRRVDGPVWAWVARTDDRLFVFLDDGSVVGDVALEAGERLTFVNHGTLISAAEDLTVISCGVARRPSDIVVGIETEVAPIHPEGHRRRLRLIRPGQAAVEREVVLKPARTSEILLANMGAALALLRPAPLCVASAVSPLPADWTGVYLAWWRDPWLAGGSYPGWLVASLALAAFCGWRARRAARERCATVREVRFWTAAVLLLGPVGLLWMRFVLPRVPVEVVGGARRAVNLDASPSTSAPWPEPKPLGIEVFS